MQQCEIELIINFLDQKVWQVWQDRRWPVAEWLGIFKNSICNLRNGKYWNKFLSEILFEKLTAFDRHFYFSLIQVRLLIFILRLLSYLNQTFTWQRWVTLDLWFFGNSLGCSTFISIVHKMSTFKSKIINFHSIGNQPLPSLSDWQATSWQPVDDQCFQHWNKPSRKWHSWRFSFRITPPPFGF